MGITRKPSGRFIVGLGASDLNEYKEVGALKDLFIQLTSDGCTDESQNYLNYLADYAEYHSGLGEPIMPPGVNVWLSNNGTTTAVEADDLSLEDGTYTICGITCTDGTWDFSNAGQQGGGGGSDLPEVDDADNGKVLTVVEGAWSAASASGGLVINMSWNEAGNVATLDKTFAEILDAMNHGRNCVVIDYSDNFAPEFSYAYGQIVCAEYVGLEEVYKYHIEVASEGYVEPMEFYASTDTGTLTYTYEG